MDVLASNINSTNEQLDDRIDHLRETFVSEKNNASVEMVEFIDNFLCNKLDLKDDTISIIDKLDDRLGFFVLATKRLVQQVVDTNKQKDAGDTMTVKLQPNNNNNNQVAVESSSVDVLLSRDMQDVGVQTKKVDEGEKVEDNFNNEIVLNGEMKRLAEMFDIEYYPEDGDTIEQLVSNIKKRKKAILVKHEKVLAKQTQEMQVAMASASVSKRSSKSFDMPSEQTDSNNANDTATKSTKSKWQTAVKKVTSVREKGLMSEQNRLLDKLDSLKQKYTDMEAKYDTMRHQLSKSERSNAVMATILHQRSQSSGTDMMTDGTEENERYEELLQYFQFMSQEWGHPDYEELQTISGDAEEDLF